MAALIPTANISVDAHGLVTLSWTQIVGGPPVISLEMDGASARELGEAIFKAGSVAAERDGTSG